MEDKLNGRQPPWKTTSMEDKLKRKRAQGKKGSGKSGKRFKVNLNIFKKKST